MRRTRVWCVALLMTGSLSTTGVCELKPLTLEAIFDGVELEAQMPQDLRCLDDGESVIFRLEEDGTETLWREHIPSGKRTRIADWTATLEELKGLRPDYQPPPLPDANSAARSRTSPTLAAQALIGIAANDLFRLDLETGMAAFLTNDPDPELFPTASPDGARLAFVHNGDLQVLDLGDGSRTRLTDRGNHPALFNGLADWVNEEELGVERSFWWSPDGSQIAFIQYDTSTVGTYPITDEMEPYALLEEQRYPKAGTANALLRLGVVDTAGGETTWIDLGDETDIYLPRAGWTPDGAAIWYQWLNRDQTHLELRLANPRTGKSTTILDEHAATWINIRDDLVFVDDTHFVWSSERDGWRHLYLYTIGGALEKRLTSGQWQVEKVLGLDAEQHVVFQATKEDPRQRHLYSVGLDDGTLRRLSSDDGTHNAELAPGGRFYVETFSALDTPPRITAHSLDGALLWTIADGAIPALAEYQQSPVELGTVKAEDGTILYTCMVKPPDFDASRRYPVLLYVYGGPHAQLVRDAWGSSRLLFYQYLAQQGMIVFWLDNRGTWGRGHAFEAAIHRRLGELELADQLAGVRYLKTLPYVDARRMAAYGGSYGGYLTLLCMLRAPEVFRAGIAYAPVTDWRLYDTIYTERYMDRPQDNPDGYHVSAPLSHADQLAGKLLVAHGTMDNNVHLQHTIQLLGAFADAGKTCDLVLLPRARHGIRVSQHKLYFHRLKSDYLRTHLLSPVSTDDEQNAVH